MDKDKIESEVKNTSLMCKTKAQLIEIILRKDSVEQKLNSMIKELHKEVECINDDGVYLQNNYDGLKDDYDYICDENATLNCKIDNIHKNYCRILCVIIVLFIISVIMNIIFI